MERKNSVPLRSKCERISYLIYTYTPTEVSIVFFLMSFLEEIEIKIEILENSTKRKLQTFL